MKAKFVRLTQAIVPVTHHPYVGWAKDGHDGVAKPLRRDLSPDWIDKGNNTALVCEAYTRNEEVVKLPLDRKDANGSLISQERMIERHSSVL